MATTGLREILITTKLCSVFATQHAFGWKKVPVFRFIARIPVKPFAGGHLVGDPSLFVTGGAQNRAGLRIFNPISNRFHPLAAFAFTAPSCWHLGQNSKMRLHSFFDTQPAFSTISRVCATLS